MRSEPVRADVAAFDAVAPAYDAWYAMPLGRLVDRLDGCLEPRTRSGK